MLELQQDALNSFRFTPLTAPSENFTKFGETALNNKGLAVFSAARSSSPDFSGIYTSRGRELNTVADLSTLPSLFADVANPTDPLAQYSFGEGVAINSDGDVLFEGKLTSQSIDRLFLKTGDKFLKVGEVRSNSSGPTSTISSITDFKLNDRDQVVYSTLTNVTLPRDGSFRETKIVFDGATIASGVDIGRRPSIRVFEPEITNDGTVYYASRGSRFDSNNSYVDLNNVYRLDPGAPAPVRLNIAPLYISTFDVNDQGIITFSGNLGFGLPSPGDKLFRLDVEGFARLKDSVDGSPSINDREFTAYQQRDTISVLQGTVDKPVIAPGDVLFGRTVSGTKLGEINDRNQIVFSAQFSDGTVGVFRANPRRLLSEQITYAGEDLLEQALV